MVVVVVVVATVAACSPQSATAAVVAASVVAVAAVVSVVPDNFATGGSCKTSSDDAGGKTKAGADCAIPACCNSQNPSASHTASVGGQNACTACVLLLIIVGDRHVFPFLFLFLFFFLFVFQGGEERERDIYKKDDCQRLAYSPIRNNLVHNDIRWYFFHKDDCQCVQAKQRNTRPRTQGSWLVLLLRVLLLSMQSKLLHL